MANFRGQIEARLGLNDKPFRQSLDRSQKRLKGFGDKLGPLGKKLAGVFAVGALVQFGRAVINTASKLSDLATQINVNVETFQALKVATDDAGVQVETLRRALRNVQDRGKQAAAGQKSLAKAFETLGINVRTFNDLKAEEQLERVGQAAAQARAKGLNPMSEVMDIIGEEAGPELREVLDRLANDGLPAIRKEAEDAGLVMRKETVSSLDETADASVRLKTQFFNALAPVIAKLGELFSSLAGAIGRNSGVLKSLAPLVKPVVAVFTALASLLLLNKVRLFAVSGAVKAWAAATKVAAVAQRVFTAATVGATAATRGFATALASTGIGAIAVALGFATGKLIEYLGASDDAKQSSEKFGKSTEDLDEALKQSQVSAKAAGDAFGELAEKALKAGEAAREARAALGEVRLKNAEKIRQQRFEELRLNDQILSLQANINIKENDRANLIQEIESELEKVDKAEREQLKSLTREEAKRQGLLDEVEALQRAERLRGELSKLSKQQAEAEFQLRQKQKKLDESFNNAKKEATQEIKKLQEEQEFNSLNTAEKIEVVQKRIKEQIQKAREAEEARDIAAFEKYIDKVIALRKELVNLNDKQSSGRKDDVQQLAELRVEAIEKQRQKEKAAHEERLTEIEEIKQAELDQIEATLKKEKEKIDQKASEGFSSLVSSDLLTDRQSDIARSRDFRENQVRDDETRVEAVARLLKELREQQAQQAKDRLNAQEQAAQEKSEGNVRDKPSLKNQVEKIKEGEVDNQKFINELNKGVQDNATKVQELSGTIKQLNNKLGGS